MKTLALELLTLYKQTATGAVQQWTVRVYSGENGAGEVETIYGQLGGAMQTTSDTVSVGKNIGKKNETSPLQQASLQAQQTWDKKVKQGYVRDPAAAAETTNALGAIKPMLAHVYEDHPKKVSWPAYVQPKLDGMRCIAIVKDGVCSLYSRTQKQINTMPHVVAQIEAWSKHLNQPDFIFDGELYAHALSSDFNKIMSIIKRNEVHPEHELVQYHIYDLLSAPGGFEQRLEALHNMVVDDFAALAIKIVETQVCESEEEMMAAMAEFIECGYEGLMYRRPDAPYEGKRSHGLLKVKTFRDEEFKAVGVEEGNGKLQGKAGAIWCITKDGKRFKAKMQGTLESLTDYLVNFEKKYMAGNLTVKFQNYTPDGIPRFPVGIRFRREE